MEEHKGVVLARKSKCVVPTMKSKVEAMDAGVPIYSGGSDGVAVMTAGALLIRPYLTTSIGAALAPRTQPWWRWLQWRPSLHGFLSLHHHLLIGGMQAVIVIQLVLNLYFFEITTSRVFH